MKAIDTNIVVRLAMNDNFFQTREARRVLGEAVLLPLTVIMESEWVLRSRYGLDRMTIATALTALLDTAGVSVADEADVRYAMARFREGADLPDMLHLISAKGAERFVTFDRKLARSAGENPPVQVETLAP